MSPIILPQEISSRILRDLAPNPETAAIRVVMQAVGNSTAFRLRGKRRTYIFERDGRLGAHVLDIPSSLWQHDLPDGAYRDNASICNDLQNITGIKIPLVFLIIPWGEVQADVSDGETSLTSLPALSEAIPTLRDFFDRLGAPPIVGQALDILAAQPLDVFREFVQSIKPAPPLDEVEDATSPVSTLETKPKPVKEKSDSPAAIRMRKSRARKKERLAAAKKTAKKAAKKAGKRKSDAA